MKNIMKLAAVSIAALVCIIGLTACGNSSESGGNAKTKIVVGTTGLTPGASEQGNDASKDGGVQGMDIDIIKEVAKRNNWDVEWKVAPVDALFGMMDNKQITTIANTIAINEKRKEKYNFDDPYAYGSYSLVAKSDGPVIDSMDSLKGKSVAVLANGDQKISLEQTNEKYNLGMKILAVDDNGAVLQSVINGTTDLAYIGTSAAALANKSLHLNLQLFDPGNRDFKLVHPFLKTEESDKIREQMNKTIHEMREDGTLKEISMKWFGKDLTVQPEAKK
jgi:ABC-type amino acid transport substrate-binding protein